MKIKAKLAMLIGTQVVMPGDVVDVEEDRAKNLIQLGHAEQFVAPVETQVKQRPKTETQVKKRPTKKTEE